MRRRSNNPEQSARHRKGLKHDMPMKSVTVHRWQVIAAFIILALSFVASLVWIQNGRLESCKHTYQGVEDVFQPFKPPPSQLKGEQKKNWDKFDNRVQELKAGCSKQIKLYYP